MRRIKITDSIKCNKLIYRQTRTSKFSYYRGKWYEFEEDICATMFYLLHNGNNIDGIFQCDGYQGMTLKVLDGYRDGVIILELANLGPGTRFYSTIDTNEPDNPTLKKVRAKCVQIILYHCDILLEADSERELTGADWEIMALYSFDPTIAQ